MDAAILKNIKNKLLEEKTKLEEQLGQFTLKNVHNPDDYQAKFPDFGEKDEDNAVEVAQYSDNLTLERSLESSLRDVNKALDNIEKNRYGICKYCKNSIDVRRLSARPTSSACIACKKQLTQ